MEKKYRLEHISRLSAGNCIPATGVIFLDALSNVERISDHADNIANYIIEVHEKDKLFSIQLKNPPVKLPHPLFLLQMLPPVLEYAVQTPDR